MLFESNVDGPSAGEGSGLLSRSGSGFVLPNTRKITVLLDLSATGPRSTDLNIAGADNLALVLRIEPIFGVYWTGGGQTDSNSRGAARPAEQGRPRMHTDKFQE